MTTDYRDLITRMAKELDDYRQLLLDDRTVTHRLSDEARAVLADEPAVPEVVGSEWQPCGKLPITVHVREQRPGEQHVSTREGITPVQPDDLIMLGVDGEEYPIGRELFQRTYSMGSADEPAVPEGREPAAVTGQPRPMEDDVEDAAQCIYEAMRFERVETTPAWSELGNSLAQDTARKAARAVLAHWGNHAPAPPADGEVAELVRTLTGIAHWRRRGRPGEGDPSPFDIRQADRLDRAAELLQRQAPQPPADGEVVEVMGLFRHWAEAYPDSVTVDPYWLTRAAELLQRQAPQPPADGEVAELAAEIRHFLAGYQQMRGSDPEHIYSIHRGDKMEAHITVSRLTRAAELLQRQVLVPVSVSERPWEREGWCDVEGRFWAEHISRSGVASWRCAAASDLGGWAVRCLPAHALPLPEVGA